MSQQDTFVSEVNAVVGVALSRTGAALAGSVFKALRSLFVLAIGAAIHFQIRVGDGSKDPSGDVMGEVLLWVSYIAVPALVIAGVVFLWNLWLAPYRLAKDEARKIEGRLEKASKDAITEFNERVAKVEGRLTAQDHWRGSLFDQEVLKAAETAYMKVAHPHMKSMGRDIQDMEGHIQSLNELYGEVNSKVVFSDRNFNEWLGNGFRQELDNFRQMYVDSLRVDFDLLEEKMNKNIDEKFDALLSKMTGPSAQKPTSTPKASSRGGSDDCDETQTRPDTSKDASD